MFEYISAKEAAEKWGISKRRIQKLCEEKRIDGVVLWAMPGQYLKMLKNPKMDVEKKIERCEAYVPFFNGDFSERRITYGRDLLY